MKKRLAVTMIALSLASGFLAFRYSGQERFTEEILSGCHDESCRDGEEDGRPKCCKDTEMCCE